MVTVNYTGLQDGIFIQNVMSSDFEIDGLLGFLPYRRGFFTSAVEKDIGSTVEYYPPLFT